MGQDGESRLPDHLGQRPDHAPRLDLRPELGKVNVPVLVLVGEHDEATPPPMSRELAALLPNARLKIIAGCAHVPQLQAPDMFLDAIGDFLREPLAAK
jgi:3-oxoadipate enol-lactonase